MRRTLAFLAAMAFGLGSGLLAVVTGNTLAAWGCGLAAGAVLATLNVMTHPDWQRRR